MSTAARFQEISSVLDEGTAAELYEDFASSGDLPQLAELLSGFLERAASQLNTICAAVGVGDAEAIRQASHKLKGSSRTLGAGLLGQVAANIERAAADLDVPAARRELPELEGAFSLSRSALLDVIERIDPA